MQFLRPDKFDVVVKCVIKIPKFDLKISESQVSTPSLALHIGHSLKKMRGLLEDVEHFEKLMEAEGNYLISHHDNT